MVNLLFLCGIMLFVDMSHGIVENGIACALCCCCCFFFRSISCLCSSGAYCIGSIVSVPFDTLNYSSHHKTSFAPHPQTHSNSPYLVAFVFFFAFHFCCGCFYSFSVCILLRIVPVEFTAATVLFRIENWITIISSASVLAHHGQK